jgi:hypothetical protein
MRTLLCLISILTSYCFSQQSSQQDSIWKGPKFFFQGGFGTLNTSKLYGATVDIMGDMYKFEESKGFLLIDFRLGIRIKPWLTIVPYTTFLFSGYEVHSKYTDMGFPAKEKTDLIFLPGSAIRYEYFLNKISLVGEFSASPIISSPAFDQLTLKGTGPSLGFLTGLRYRVFELLLGYTGIPVKYCNSRVGAGITPRPSSNRTCGFPAYGSPIYFIRKHTR